MEVLKFTDQLRAAGVTNGNGQLLAEMATKDAQNRLSSKTQQAIQLTNRVCRLTLIPGSSVTCSKVLHPKDMRTARADTERLPSTFKRARFASNTTGMKSSAIPPTLGRFESWPILWSTRRTVRESSAVPPKTTCPSTSGLTSRKPCWRIFVIEHCAIMPKESFWRNESSASRSVTAREKMSLSDISASSMFGRIWGAYPVFRTGQ